MSELPRLAFAPGLVEDSSELNCPFCHDPIVSGQEVVQCPQCASWHHADCWEALGNRCSQMGCEGEGELGPPPPPPPPTIVTTLLEPSWLDEIELTPAELPAPEQAELLGQLVNTIELLPADETETILDIDLPANRPTPAPAPPPQPPSVNCPYCQNPVDLARSDVVACRVCHTPYHPSCWAAAGGCAVLGCDSRRSVPYSSVGSAPTTVDVDVLQKKDTFLNRLKTWWANRS